jgi:hypothetical protein
MKSGSSGRNPKMGYGTIYHSLPFPSRINFGVLPGLLGQEF